MRSLRALRKQQSAKTESGEARQPIWLEAVRVGVPLLWFIFAVVAFTRLLPLAETVLKEGGINNIKIGIIEVQLQHVTAKAGADPVQIAKADLFIPKEKQKQITSRFARMSENTKGAALLWVDDNHPYQNVTERRVFLAANIYVDLARSTSEAMRWLSRSKYDVVITDMERREDLAAPCLTGPEHPPTAGCALLKRMGDCILHGGPNSEPLSEHRVSDDRARDEIKQCRQAGAIQRNKMPALIVYSAQYPQSLGVPYRARVTNRADELFEFVLDALEQRQLIVNDVENSAITH
jgi:hypothetical protein